MSFALNLTSSAVLPKLLASASNKKVQQKVAHLIIVLLVIYIAFISAKITWFIVPETNASSLSVVNSPEINGNEKKSNGFDLTNLQALNLFGIYNEKEIVEPVVAVQDAPETRLQLTLSGLVASDDVTTSAAIIEYQGKQETYGIGDLIVGTRANIEQILFDRVIIKQSGKLETLMLDGVDFTDAAARMPRQVDSDRKVEPALPEPSVLDHRNNTELSNSAKNLREDLSEDPGKITDYLSISPQRKNGEIVGYSLRPGKSPEFFELSGLKAGDVAVQMNGYDLALPSEAAQALMEMKEVQDISLLIERNGSLMEVLFSIE